jgi:Bacterial dipeptidyl-peptidase Sh3 domain/NlpC/P60 family
MTGAPRSQFSLSGTSISLDARTHAVRGDLADLALAGQLFVPHYARPMAMRCTSVRAALRDIAKPEGKQVSELLFGEDFMVIDIAADWAWGYCRHDHYVGYIPLSDLIASDDSETETITVREAVVFKTGTDEARDLTLPMGAKISGAPAGDMIETAIGRVAAGAIGATFNDAASVAEALVDTPYHWGGRSAHGIDCSGLIQLSLALSSGLPAPRDSDQQQFGLGEDLPADAPLARNDIIFFPGHVGIMRDGENLIHATMHYGKTVIEPLTEVIARIGKDHDTPVLARKRIG